MATPEKFSVVCKTDEAVITLYDVIDGFWGVSAMSIYDALKAANGIKTIRVRINSPGGSVFEGMAIYNLLKSHSARKIVNVDGLAASMASVVAMAGDEIEMGEGAFLMIHDPLTRATGDSDDLREMADVLDKLKQSIVGIYAKRTGQTEDVIAQWMTDETWMTAGEAVNSKFADRTVAGMKVAAVAPTGFFNKVPEALRPPEPKESPEMADTKKEPQPATYAELVAICGDGEHAFICSQQAAAATIEAAAKAWTASLVAQRDEARAEAVAAKAEAAEAKAKAARPGVEALGGGTKQDGGTDPVAEFTTAVDAKVKAGLSKAKATAAVVRDNPELHAAYVAARNNK